MKQVLYSQRFSELASLVVIEGIVTKYRGHDVEEATIETVTDYVINERNVLIQKEGELHIYCRQKEYDFYKSIILGMKNKINSSRFCNINFYVNGICINGLSINWFNKNHYILIREINSELKQLKSNNLS